MVYLQLEGATPQRTATRRVKLQAAVMPEPDLEIKPWSSSARDGQEKRAHMRRIEQKSAVRLTRN